MRSSRTVLVLSSVLALCCFWGFRSSSHQMLMGGGGAAQFIINPVNAINQALTMDAHAMVSTQHVLASPDSTQIWNIGFQMVNNEAQQVVYTTGPSGNWYLAHHYDAGSMSMSVVVRSSPGEETGWMAIASAGSRPSSIRLYTTSPSSPAYAFALMSDANGVVALSKISPENGWGAANHAFDWTTTIYP